MKKNKFFAILLAGLTLGFAACNNSGEGGYGKDDSLKDAANNTAVNTEVSTNEYSAFADEIEKNSQSGRYLDARTGKPIKLKVNRSTGEIIDETSNEPVWRYIDNTNWWVYGIDDTDWEWETLGEARIENDMVMYKSDDGKWVTYDTYWKVKDDDITKSWKAKSGDTKIKVSKDGDIKVKDEKGKTKYDADDNKIKRDSN